MRAMPANFRLTTQGGDRQRVRETFWPHDLHDIIGRPGGWTAKRSGVVDRRVDPLANQLIELPVAQ
jgi:hypothetical protein